MSDKESNLAKAKKFLPIIISLLVAVAVLGGGLIWLNFRDEDTETVNTTPPVTEQSQEPEKEPGQPSVATKQELLEEVNKRRAEVGAAALQHSAALEASAQQKCEDMSANNYFGHQNPVTGVWGYNLANNALGDGTYSENLTKGPQRTAVDIFNKWFASEPHKTAALDGRYTLTGFGVCVDKTDTLIIIVQHFWSQQNTMN